MIAFGPIPSRRLGQSLGVNHIPLKNCTFDCIYCQVGRTTHLGVKRRAFYEPEEVFRAVEKRVREVERAGGHIDHISLVPDGESTVDIHLGEIIRLLQGLDYPIAVITNASLLWMEEVREALQGIDCISIKVDAAIEDTWREVNRPNPMLSLPQVLEGIRRFLRSFDGRVFTETMLVRGVNDNRENIEATAAFLKTLQPEKAFLIAPTRPPAEPWVEMPDERHLNRAYQVFRAHGLEAELLTGFSHAEFSSSGDIDEELLSITSVHPLRESEVLEIIDRSGEERTRLEQLVQDGKLIRTVYDETIFYLRKLPAKGTSS